MFGALAIIGTMLVRKSAPETKGRQLEEIQRFRGNDGQRRGRSTTAPVSSTHNDAATEARR
ncbi:hypothetical protein J2Y66_001858 [Paenarthrobacter nitroguajacolicus]|nr:hypothetical protein [Paenarthrobacter nitroguajacolicus]